MKRGLSICCLLIGGLLLSGCGSKDTDMAGKQAFFVDTVFVSALSGDTMIEKPGTTKGTQEITVTAQAMGRVQSKLVQEGVPVLAGQPIVSLADVLANYGSQLERARNTLDKAIIQKDNTILSLNNAVDNAGATLSQAQQALRIAEQNVEQTLKAQELAVRQSSNTTTSTLDALLSNYTLQRSTLLSQLTTILNQVDTLLGVTPIYESDNDAFEIYISAKDTQQKQAAEALLKQLYTVRDTIVAATSSGATVDVLRSLLPVFHNGYAKAQELLESMQSVLIASVSAPSFPQATLDNYYASTTTQLSSLITAKSAFVTYQQNAETQLALISEQGLQGIDYSQETAKISLEQARLNAENTIINAQTTVENADRAYQQAVSNRDVQLAVLDTTIAEAQLGYQDALKQFNKLSVTSPIRGTVGSILVDVGQELAVGTPVFTVVSLGDQLVTVYFTADEYSYVSLGQEVSVAYKGLYYSGSIQSLSPIADESGQYKAIVALQEPLQLVGDIVNVLIPIRVSYPVLPLSIVTSTARGKGYIYVLEDGQLRKEKVNLGRVWGDVVEIHSDIAMDWEIIVSDISAFNDQDFYLSTTGAVWTGSDS